MTKLNSVPITKKMVQHIRDRLLECPEIFAIESEIEFSSWLISYGISREVGSVNDELSRFLFDFNTGVLIPRETLKAEVVLVNGNVGIRIFSSSCASIEVRIKGFRDLCHPDFSENTDGSYRQLVIFPEIIARVAALEGIELVVVRSWALNSIFGGFDKTKGYYETNFWELENNDSVLFASLVENRKLALLGTHDLIAHVSGIQGKSWQPLSKNATKVRQTIESYVGKGQPSIPDLVLPYTVGVILDDLAQPPSYLSSSHQIMLDAVLRAMSAPRSKLKNAVLLKYPSTFEKVIRMSRDKDTTPENAKKVVECLVKEINMASARIA